MLIEREFCFLGNLVTYRSEGYDLTFRVKPRKKQIFLKQKYCDPYISCKEFSREFNRVISVIKAYYKF